MKKRILIVVGLILIGSSVLWRFGLAAHWAERIPAGWQWESNYIGTQTFADPQTGQMPEKDVTGIYNHSINIVAKSEQPGSVELDDRYVIHDITIWKPHQDSDSISL